MNTNVKYWEKVLEEMTPLYKVLFDAEHEYLTDHVLRSDRVLDIGCGDGKNTRSILEITQDVVAIDHDPQAVEDAQENLRDFPSVEILQADARDLPFKDNSFDCVVIFEVIANLADNKRKVFEEIKRVLKENGRILGSVFSEDAFEARMEMYTKLNAPIKEVRGTTVIFDESLGANISEQFSLEEIKEMVGEVGFEVSDSIEIDQIGYIFELRRRDF